MKEVEIDYDQRWLPVHWGSLCAAYGKSPFFDYYISDFEKIFSKKYKFLFDFNFQLLTLCLKFLGINISVNFTSGYLTGGNADLTDWRDIFSPKNKSANLNGYGSYSYKQNFGKQFVPGLSIVDLLFCEGNYAMDVIQQSNLSKEQNTGFNC